MNKAVVFILLDAFRWDYIDEINTTFLWKLGKKGIYVRKIKPSFSFCERTEMLTGMRPNKSMNFTAIGFMPESSFYREYKTLLKILSIFDVPKITRRKFRWLLNHIFRHLGAKLQTYEIPLNLLPYLDLTEDKMDHNHKEAFINESIIDVMNKTGKDVYYDSFTALGMPYKGNDDDRMQLVLNNANNGYHLYLLYIGEPDSVGHYYDPGSEEIKRMKSRIDKKIQNFVESLSNKVKDVAFVVLGDHGMVEVNTYINVWDKVKQFTKLNGLREEKDYLMFLDSTLARFWAFNEKAMNLLLRILSTPHFVKQGRIIDEKMADKYHIPLGFEEYGHILWSANPGVVIYPDFFHSTIPVKGMHGYNPDYPDSKGFCIIVDNAAQPRVIDHGELIDVCPTICDLVKIPYPLGNQGKSLLIK